MLTAEDHRVRATLDRTETEFVEQVDAMSTLGMIALEGGFAGLVSAGIMRPSCQKAICECVIYAAATAKYLSRQREDES